MTTLTKQDIIGALTRLGQLAEIEGERIELLLLGGSLMVLLFETRLSTHDVDVIVLAPTEIAKVRAIVTQIASEKSWAADWLNDAVKGFFVGETQGPVVFSAPGIEVRRPSIEQLLAMKLCAWRDDVDIADARRLLQELPSAYDQVWQAVVPFLQPGRELTARYAFDDLWEEIHGANR